MSSATPADNNIPAWPFNHPDWDPPPEPLITYGEEDQSYLPTYISGANHVEPESEAYYHQLLQIQSRSAASRHDWDVVNPSDVALEEITPIGPFEAGSSSISQDLIDCDVNNSRQSHCTLPCHRQRLAPRKKMGYNYRDVVKDDVRTIFIQTALRMGSQMDVNRMKERYKTNITDRLKRDLLSNNVRKQQLASVNLLLPRPNHSKTLGLLPSRYDIKHGIYNNMTKDEILDHIFEIMGMAPTEDIKSWWYNQIINFRDDNTFPDLFSGDVQRQENAITRLTKFIRRGAFWKLEKRETRKREQC